MNAPQSVRIVVDVKVADKAVRIAETATGIKLSRSVAVAYVVGQAPEKQEAATDG